jgi:hypothetical protein
MTTLYFVPFINTVPAFDDNALPVEFSVLKVKVAFTVLNVLNLTLTPSRIFFAAGSFWACPFLATIVAKKIKIVEMLFIITVLSLDDPSP